MNEPAAEQQALTQRHRHSSFAGWAEGTDQNSEESIQVAGTGFASGKALREGKRAEFNSSWPLAPPRGFYDPRHGRGLGVSFCAFRRSGRDVREP